MYSVASSIRNMGTLLRLASVLDSAMLEDLFEEMSKWAGTYNVYDIKENQKGLKFDPVHYKEHQKKMEKIMEHAFTAKSFPDLMKQIGDVIKLASEENQSLKGYSRFFNGNILGSEKFRAIEKETSAPTGDPRKVSFKDLYGWAGDLVDHAKRALVSVYPA